MGIRWRIVLLVGLAVALAVIAAAIGSYFAVRSELLAQLDDSIRGPAHGIETIAAQGPLNPKRLPDHLRAPPQAAPPAVDSGLRVQRISRNGSVSRFPPRSGSLPVSAADRAVARQGSGSIESNASVGGHEFRVFTVGVGKNGAIMLGRSLDGVNRVLANLRLTLALLALGGIGLALGLALLIGRRVVAPIQKLTEAAEHISATNDLGRRIDVDGNDEVARLASRFNAMLETIAEHHDALERSVKSQRSLVADSSHELRTPVAALRTDLETMLRHPELSVEERTEILVSAEERIEELTDLVRDVTDLARADETVEEADEMRLDLIARDSAARLSRLSPSREIIARLQPTVIQAHPDRLFRAINNLLDNADNYSAANQPIEIEAADGRVAVRDYGPGIPESDLPRLFDRFWRGSTSRQRPGSGLGLAIVRQVVEGNGGEVAVENLSSGGVRFTLTFPVVDDGASIPAARSEPVAPA